ncbi:hypothetical protein BKA62DRAFT_223329 [Auriculariales sp. MPI-PUGE-AT-0066]|nr:hypothetical protein BKA62DRAFT_223329 [Auriculariales sp. MPI-PUGE-AT-0066]
MLPRHSHPASALSAIALSFLPFLLFNKSCLFLGYAQHCIVDTPCITIPLRSWISFVSRSLFSPWRSPRVCRSL